MRAITSRFNYTAPDSHLSAGFAKDSRLSFTIRPHETQKNCSKGICAIILEYRLNNKRPAVNVVGRYFFQRIFTCDIFFAFQQFIILHSNPFQSLVKKEKRQYGWLLAAEGTSSGRSSTGVSPRPMLMGAAHNAVWAFSARVSLTLPVCHRPQAATLALRSGAVRSPVTVVPSCGLETRSWRTGRMARHKQECIRLPYTAALASQRAFFVKVLPPAMKERNRERVSCFRFQTGLVSSC